MLGNHFFLKTGNLNTLIIDDEIDICFLLSGILKQKGCFTNYVNNLADAEVALKSVDAAIVFLDNHLPDGLGADFAAEIKKNYPSIKIIMITAYDTIEDRQHAFKKGVDFFIPKPFSKEAIVNALEFVQKQ